MAPTRQQPPPLYSKDEKVLCFHGELLYEAKIMDVQAGDKSGDGEAWDYKVHYKGWKKTWDDWVGKDRIRPFDDEHKELAAQLHAQAKRSMQATAKQTTKTSKVGNDSTRGSEERGSAAVQGGRGGRRGKDWELEQVSSFFPLLFVTAIFRLHRCFCASIIPASLHSTRS
jgi:mortality factor 4-like protein 1